MELVTDEKTNTMIITKGCILKTNTTHRNDEVYQSILVTVVQTRTYKVENRILKFTKSKNGQY